MAREEAECRLTILCPKKSLLSSSSAGEGVGLRWLIGSPLSLPPLTVVSAIRCLHSLPGAVDPYSPDILREADDLRSLLIRGFDIIGALFVGNINLEEGARKAIEASSKLRSLLLRDEVHDLIGAVADPVSGDIQFCISHFAKTTKSVNNVVYEDNPERYMWEKGCLLRCDLEFKLPVFLPEDKVSDFELNITSSIDAAAAKLRDPNVAYLIQGSDISTAETSRSILVHGTELDLNSHYSVSGTSNDKSSITGVTCSDLCRKNKAISLSVIRENADAIHVTVLSNKSRNKSENAAPHAEYFPAPGRARVLSIDFNLDVLCFSSEDLPISDAISKLIIPGLCDQLDSMKNAILPEILSQHPQLRPYHFLPPRLLHPITVIYELSYGETEVKQGEIRKSLHSRLNLPLDRPLLRISNALNFGINAIPKNGSMKPGYSVLKDVHSELPSSGVSGGIISLIDGSYEYYHYLHGIDDNGWGCAYRSLQTIISWYRLQKYTSIEVPSHREIQQALVEIGDKEPSFVGSREWIGAIELSFVLDKLLGVSCKIINVRSGEELPEKCRELAMHFETQGTPVMIGGGVLAYTLLGVDYNEVSGDCAFLILDPHYTGSDNIKKIVNGGWCGWKKSVDAKGHSFFLKDKFYNLLLPQRPNMV